MPSTVIPGLPPLLRVAGILGLVLPPASCALGMTMLPTRLSTSDWPRISPRVFAIGLNLTMLGGSFPIVVATYNMRACRLGTGPFALDSWQGQVQTLLLLAALPLCALAWAVVTPLPQPGFSKVSLISMLAACVLGGVCVCVLVTHQAAD